MTHTHLIGVEINDFRRKGAVNFGNKISGNQ